MKTRHAGSFVSIFGFCMLAGTVATSSAEPVVVAHRDWGQAKAVGANTQVAVGGYSSPVIRIFGIADGRFEPLSSLEVPQRVTEIHVTSQVAVLNRISDPRALDLVDITDPEHPAMLSTLMFDADVLDAKVEGEMLYLALGDAGVEIYDLSDRFNPALYAAYPSLPARAVGPRGDRLATSLPTGGMTTVWDLSDVSSPSHVADVFFSGNNIFLRDGHVVFDGNGFFPWVFPFDVPFPTVKGGGDPTYFIAGPMASDGDRIWQNGISYGDQTPSSASVAVSGFNDKTGRFGSGASTTYAGWNTTSVRAIAPIPGSPQAVAASDALWFFEPSVGIIDVQPTFYTDLKYIDGSLYALSHQALERYTIDPDGRFRREAIAVFGAAPATTSSVQFGDGFAVVRIEEYNGLYTSVSFRLVDLDTFDFVIPTTRPYSELTNTAAVLVQGDLVMMDNTFGDDVFRVEPDLSLTPIGATDLLESTLPSAWMGDTIVAPTFSGIRILDASDVTAIEQVGFYSTPIDFAHRVDLISPTTMVFRIGDEISLVDITEPAQPAVLSTIDPTNPDESIVSWGIVDDTLSVVLLRSQGLVYTTRLVRFNISDPSNTALVGEVDDLPVRTFNAVRVGDNTLIEGLVNGAADRSWTVYAFDAAGCIADFDGNGELDFADANQFVLAFNAQDPAADIAEPFGTFNFFDMAGFIDAFNVGCP